ncbi:hypothetical protein, partial [Oleiphilus sp. HI0128]
MSLNFLDMPVCLLSEELKLQRAYIQKQEQLLSSFTENIESHIETYEQEMFVQTHAEDEGEIIRVDLEHINGVTEQDYDIRSLFSQSMTMYQRQSMLLTLWAMLESELERIYLYTSEQLNKGDVLPRRPKDKSKFLHLIEQFEKLECLTEPTQEFRESIDLLNNQVRIIRNAWAHDGGVDLKSKLPEVIDGISKKNNKINISGEYIDKAWNMMNIVSKE